MILGGSNVSTSYARTAPHVEIGSWLGAREEPCIPTGMCRNHSTGACHETVARGSHSTTHDVDTPPLAAALPHAVLRRVRERRGHANPAPSRAVGGIVGDAVGPVVADEQQGRLRPRNVLGSPRVSGEGAWAVQGQPQLPGAAVVDLYGDGQIRDAHVDAGIGLELFLLRFLDDERDEGRPAFADGLSVCWHRERAGVHPERGMSPQP